MALPTNIDASYPDRDSGDALHQQHHDTVHGILNDPAANWTEGNAAYLRTYDVKNYGAVGDWNGTTGTDDTAAIQAAIDAAEAADGGIVFFPAGNYRVTAKLNTKQQPGLHLVGAGKQVAFITQTTDNTPIFDFGAVAGSQLHSWSLLGMTLTYSAVQAAANTNAIPVKFSAMAYQGDVRNLGINRGAYGIQVATGIGCPWGTTWDNISFGGDLSLGAMNFEPGVNAVPNNHFGRILVDASSMTGPVFRMRGYNFVVDTVEVISADQGAKLWEQITGQVQIGTLKLENGSYTASQSLIEAQSNAHIGIGHLFVGGDTMTLTPTSGRVALLSLGAGGGTNGQIVCQHVDVNATTQSGTVVVVAVTGGARVELGHVVLAGGWALADNATTTASNILNVATWNNGRLSDNKGDADYTVALGDPNVISYETALTLPRTVTLPNTLNNLFNGLRYRIRSDGAVNGSNVISVVAGATTIATLRHPNSVVEIEWRRAATAAGGWVVISRDDGDPVEFGRVDANETTTSTTYADLTTVGPEASVQIGSSGKALVTVSATIKNSGTAGSYMAFAVSGATTRAAQTGEAASVQNTNYIVSSRTSLVTGLNPGLNTFTAKYVVDANTGNFLRRTITVVPIP